VLGLVRDLGYIFTPQKARISDSEDQKASKEFITMRHILLIRSFASLARLAAVAVALCFGIAAQAQAADQSPASQSMTPAPAKGEFDNMCTEGLASGQLTKTDC